MKSRGLLRRSRYAERMSQTSARTHTSILALVICVACASPEPHRGQAQAPSSSTPVSVPILPALPTSAPEEGPRRAVVYLIEKIGYLRGCDPKLARVPVPTGEARGTEELLEAALSHLLAGVTKEQEKRGLRSVFQPESAGLLHGVTLTNGRAVINFKDLRGLIEYQASCSSMLFGSQLDETIFQFMRIERYMLQFDGSCAKFSSSTEAGTTDCLGGRRG